MGIDKTGNWISTYTGRVFYPLNPQPESIDIRDIAHALSLMTRFNGHCSTFYSIAEHSVRCYNLFNSRYHGYTNQLSRRKGALRVLLHDAAEAYVSDCPRPIKPLLKGFKEIEDSISEVIYKKFWIDGLVEKERGSFESDLKEIDMRLLATEARDLIRNCDEWVLSQPPLSEFIVPHTPQDAERMFLEALNEECTHYKLARQNNDFNKSLSR